jgi:hypothetical protein
MYKVMVEVDTFLSIDRLIIIKTQHSLNNN